MALLSFPVATKMTKPHRTTTRTIQFQTNPNNDDKPLKAYFTASPNKQTEPSMDVVIYPDSVANDEVVYAWNFGDGIGEVWMDNTEYQNSFVHHVDTDGHSIRR